MSTHPNLQRVAKYIEYPFFTTTNIEKTIVQLRSSRIATKTAGNFFFSQKKVPKMDTRTIFPTWNLGYSIHRKYYPGKIKSIA